MHIPRLTERFYRVEDSRSSATGGTGLGLAIVKHVAATHGARLQIESKVGREVHLAWYFPRRGMSSVNSGLLHQWPDLLRIQRG